MSILKTGNIDFCTECREWTPYILKKGTGEHEIDGKTYAFPITNAVCNVCGAYMSPPGLIDLNVEEYCDWYEEKFHRPINRGRAKVC